MFGIEASVLAGFIATSIAIIISPGPDTLVILRHAINGGRGPGLAAVGGVQLGLVVHTVLAVAGISLIIASNPALLQGVAVVGAAYLAWIGIQSLKGGAGLKMDDNGGNATDAARASGVRAMREGALSNILNPKVILLFLALYPNFVDYQRDDVSAQLITLSILMITLNVFWLTPMALAADALRRWLSSPAVRTGVNRVSGGMLLVMAALMLAQHLL